MYGRGTNNMTKMPEIHGSILDEMISGRNDPLSLAHIVSEYTA